MNHHKDVTLLVICDCWYFGARLAVILVQLSQERECDIQTYYTYLDMLRINIYDSSKLIYLTNILRRLLTTVL